MSDIQDDTPEVEVTPEMIEAGVDALSLWDQREDRAELIVESVFLRMVEASRQQRASTP